MRIKNPVSKPDTEPLEVKSNKAMRRHFLDLFDIQKDEALDLLDLSVQLKQAGPSSAVRERLQGRLMGLIFEKPSLRTRVSFEAAMASLGGNSLFLRGEEVGLGVRESIADFARVISQYVDALAIRTHAHSKVEELARHATIPVINALSEDAHPCQAMADVLTIREELPDVKCPRVVFVGDGNNVARSLAVACEYTGMDFLLAAPSLYKFPESVHEGFRPRAGSVKPPTGSCGRCRRDLYGCLDQHGPGGRAAGPIVGISGLPDQSVARLQSP